MKRSILFISHSAAPTGAHLFLLELIKHLAFIQTFEITLLCITDGALVSEFEKHCKVYILHRPNANFCTRLIYKALRPLQHKYLQLKKFEIVYANTIHTLSFGCQFQKARYKILHVHELATFLLPYKQLLEQHHTSYSKIVGCSQLVKEHLTSHYSIPEQKVDVITPFIKLGKLYPKPHNEYFTVGFCGGPYWIKGADLIAMIIAKTLKINPNIRFKWIGYDPEQAEKNFMFDDLYKLGVAQSVTAVSFNDKPLDNFASLDLFVLTSREESFSMVALENVALGVPVICFDQSIGAVEFIEKGAGSIVPYLDLDRIAQEIDAYSKDAQMYKKASEAGVSIAQAYSAPKILEKFELMLAQLPHEKN